YQHINEKDKNGKDRLVGAAGGMHTEGNRRASMSDKPGTDRGRRRQIEGRVARAGAGMDGGDGDGQIGE
ncbi:hypothetical protein TELCIR_21883, partial [Teladorsagia circumcincta]